MFVCVDVLLKGRLYNRDHLPHGACERDLPKHAVTQRVVYLH